MVWFWSTCKFYWQFFCSFKASNGMVENAFLTSTFALGEFGRCFGNDGMVRLWYSSSEDTNNSESFLWGSVPKWMTLWWETDSFGDDVRVCKERCCYWFYLCGNLAQDTVHSQGLFLPPFMLHCHCFILWLCYDIEFHGVALGMLVLSLFWTCQCVSWSEYDWKGLIHMEMVAWVNGHCWMCW